MTKLDKMISCDSKTLLFVFAVPGENIEKSYHVIFSHHPEDPNSIEKNLKSLRRYDDEIPEGNVAVLIYDRRYDRYHYYKTIKHRRKSFDLSCDSE